MNIPCKLKEHKVQEGKIYLSLFTKEHTFHKKEHVI